MFNGGLTDDKGNSNKESRLTTKTVGVNVKPIPNSTRFKAAS